MTNRTTAHGGAMPRIVPLDKSHTPTKTAAHGGRTAVSIDKRDEHAAKVQTRYGPYPFRPWPFNPAEPRPRPQTLRNRFKGVRRYLGSEAFSEHAQWALTFVLWFAVTMYIQGRG